jgi:undecaprenyl-diphosphatase
VHHRAGWLNPIFEGITYSGNQGIVWLVLAGALALVWRRASVFLMVLAAGVLASLTSYGLRAAIPRDRPPLEYPDPEPLVGVPGSNSFPSGHAATSFACATILCWLWPRFAAPLIALAAAIAFSRVYVGVHYPLDAMGGAGLGTALAALVLVTAPRWRAADRRRSGPRQPGG